LSDRHPPVRPSERSARSRWGPSRRWAARDGGEVLRPASRVTQSKEASHGPVR
jgi:hypothetical protein